MYTWDWLKEPESRPWWSRRWRPETKRRWFGWGGRGKRIIGTGCWRRSGEPEWVVSTGCWRRGVEPEWVAGAGCWGSGAKAKRVIGCRCWRSVLGCFGGWRRLFTRIHCIACLFIPPLHLFNHYRWREDARIHTLYDACTTILTDQFSPAELPVCLHPQKCPCQRCCHPDSFSTLCHDKRPPAEKGTHVESFLPSTQGYQQNLSQLLQTLSFSAATWALILVNTCMHFRQMINRMRLQ